MKEPLLSCHTFRTWAARSHLQAVLYQINLTIPVSLLPIHFQTSLEHVLPQRKTTTTHHQTLTTLTTLSTTWHVCVARRHYATTWPKEILTTKYIHVHVKNPASTVRSDGALLAPLRVSCHVWYSIPSLDVFKLLPWRYVVDGRRQRLRRTWWRQCEGKWTTKRQLCRFSSLATWTHYVVMDEL